VFNLKTYERIARRVARQVVDLESGQPLSRQEIALLSRHDLYRIDMAGLSRAVSALEASTEGERDLSLIVSAFSTALAHLPSRSIFLDAIEEVREFVRAGLIFDVDHVEGAPLGRIVEVLSALKPHALVTAGHFTEPPPASLKELGLQAISVDCPPSMDGEAAFAGWLRDWMRRARPVSRSVMVYGCASPRQLALARLAGASHAGLDSPSTAKA
jgi:hypothetical protein